MASRLDRLWGHRIPRSHPDYGFGVVVALVAAVTVWLAATPLAPAVARTTLARFHLRTESFWGWAIQQPVPAMYNFANRYRVDSAKEAEQRGTEHLGSVATTPIRVSGAPIESGFVNHFPTRLFSFANARLRFLRDGESRRFEFVSTYRGEAIESRYFVMSGADGELRVTLETREQESSSGCEEKKAVQEETGKEGKEGGKDEVKEEEGEQEEEGLKQGGTEDTERGFEEGRGES